MHQFGWLPERRGNFFNLLQKEGVPSEKGGGGSNPGGNHVHLILINPAISCTPERFFSVTANKFALKYVVIDMMSLMGIE